jgi:hypothetical protein
MVLAPVVDGKEGCQLFSMGFSEPGPPLNSLAYFTLSQSCTYRALGRGAPFILILLLWEWSASHVSTLWALVSGTCLFA